MSAIPRDLVRSGATPEASASPGQAAVGRRPPPSRRGRAIVRAAVGWLLVAGMAGLLAACQNRDAGGSPAAAGAVGGKGGAPGQGGGAPPPMPVSVVAARIQPLPLTLLVAGQAEGSREIEVRTRVAGIIERKLFDEGQPLKAGAPMYQLERAPFEIALAQARASVAQEQARYDDARREEARLKPLAERRAISQREYDVAASAMRTSEAARAAAQARVREAELNLSYSLVKAPIEGVTGRSLKSEGSLVTPGTEGLLSSIVQTDPIWVRFALSEPQYRKMEAGAGVEVSLNGADGKPLGTSGRINFAATTIEPRLGTVGLRAEFANPARRVLPGQFVQVQLRVGGREAALVPQQAVVQSDRGRSVWIVGDDGKAVATPVTVAEWIGSDWVVEKGLKNGDRVIVDNLMKLRPGAAVAPRDPAAPPAAGAPPGAPPAAAPAKAADTAAAKR